MYSNIKYIFILIIIVIMISSRKIWGRIPSALELFENGIVMPNHFVSFGRVDESFFRDL